MKKKICFVANSGWYLFNFKKELIQELILKGYEMYLICPIDKYSLLLKKSGLNLYHWNLKCFSTNPITDIISLFDLYKIYKKINPDLVHHFTIKPILYGSLIANLRKIPIFINSITGLGYIFIGQNIKAKLLRILIIPFYKLLLNKKESFTIFQNFNDQIIFKKLKIVGIRNSVCIRGSGVNTDYFFNKKNNLYSKNKIIKLLFPSRILKEKGILELLEACKKLSETKIKYKLYLAGSFDFWNDTKVTKKELINIISNLPIVILNQVNDMKALYKKVDIVILPSWREGLSKALLEAASMGKAIITTNTPGCSDIVSHGKTGLLVPLRDSESIFFAVNLLVRNSNLINEFGYEARKKVLNEFSSKIVNDKTIKLYKLLLKNKIIYN